MKIIALLVIVSLLIPNSSHGKAGPEISVPDIPIETGIWRARRALQSEMLKEFSKSEAKAYLEDVIIVRVEFVKYLDFGGFDQTPIPLNGWYWLVTFAKRKQNDHTWIFKVNRHETKLFRHSV